MKKNQEFRNYNFTDAELMQRIDGLILLLTRDQAELASYGLKPEVITLFRQDNEEFKAIKSDKLLKAEGVTTTMHKDHSADNLRVETRSVKVRIASLSTSNPNLFGEFSIGGLDKLTNDELFRTGRNVMTKIQQYKEQLLALGIDEDFITNYQTILQTYDTQLDDQFQADFIRNLATNNRRAKGNDLYKRMVRFASFGKDYWYTRNEAKYNDYVIYDPVTNNFGILTGTVTEATTGNPVEGAVVELDETDYTLETDTLGKFVFDKLVPGKYTITVSFDNYVEFSKADISVTKNSTTTMDVELVQG